MVTPLQPVLSLGDALDPRDIKDYQVDWSPLLNGDSISSITVQLPQQASDDGVIYPVGKSPSHDATNVLLWFEVSDAAPAAGNQDHARWDAPNGQIYTLEIEIVTDGGRRFERSFTLQVVQR